MKLKLPKNDPEIADTLHSMGIVYSKKTDYASALNCFQEALEIRRLKLPKNDPKIANTLHNMGLVSLRNYFLSTLGTEVSFNFLS